MSTAAWLALVAALGLLCAVPGMRQRVARAADWLRSPATTDGRVILAVGIASLAASSVMVILRGPPLPYVHDEFAYLLGADTLAHLRLTNPAHPLWRHFETFHVLSQPSYASKYPPGQALVLAIGQVLVGRPIVGVILSTALGVATVGWMLLAWLPRRWALLGGCLAAMHPLLLQWSWSYWGGNVALLGGALVLGAVGRLRRCLQTGHTVLLMLGVWMLFESRPFEGSLYAAPLVVAAARFVMREPELETRLRRGWVPIAVGLALTAVTTLAYDRGVTGHALTLPYQVHDRTYAITPPFVWQPLRPGIVYRDAEFAKYYLARELPQYLLHHSVQGLVLALSRKIGLLAEAYFNPFVLAVPFSVTVLGLMRGPTRKAAFLGLAVFGAALTSLWSFAHYFAPAGGAFFLAVTAGTRRLWVHRTRATPAARAFVCTVVLACVAGLAVKYVTYARSPRPAAFMRSAVDRAGVLSRLASLGGKHVVFVRYGEHHSMHDEWVYNAADIDGSTVVFARELSPAENRALIDYYPERRAWLARVDTALIELVPYSDDRLESHAAAAPP